MALLPASLQTLSLSLSHLSTSLSHLETCTHDLPRLQRVLLLHPHFALLPSTRLHSAQEKLSAEIGPEVQGLLEKVEEVVRRREGRGEWLRSRWGLYEGRLGRDSSGIEAEAETARTRTAAAAAATGKQSAKGGLAGAKANLETQMRGQRLRQQKERLSYAVERLTLQATQAERKLRMSMAAQGVRVDEGEERRRGEMEVDEEEEGDSGF